MTPRVPADIRSPATERHSLALRILHAAAKPRLAPGCHSLIIRTGTPRPTWTPDPRGDADQPVRWDPSTPTLRKDAFSQRPIRPGNRASATRCPTRGTPDRRPSCLSHPTPPTVRHRSNARRDTLTAGVSLCGARCFAQDPCRDSPHAPRRPSAQSQGADTVKSRTPCSASILRLADATKLALTIFPDNLCARDPVTIGGVGFGVRWLNVAVTSVNLTISGGILYFLVFGPVLREDGLSYRDFVTILMTAVTAILAAVTVIVAVAALWGFAAIRQSAVDQSTTEARKIAAKVARETAEPVAMKTAQEVATDVGGGRRSEDPPKWDDVNDHDPPNDG